MHHHIYIVPTYNSRAWRIYRRRDTYTHIYTYMHYTRIVIMYYNTPEEMLFNIHIAATPIVYNIYLRVYYIGYLYAH